MKDQINDIIKNLNPAEGVDVSTVIPEVMPKIYFIFKTGGYNKYMPELGAVFPYIQNIKNKKILQARLKIFIYKISGLLFIE